MTQEYPTCPALDGLSAFPEFQAQHRGIPLGNHKGNLEAPTSSPWPGVREENRAPRQPLPAQLPQPSSKRTVMLCAWSDSMLCAFPGSFSSCFFFPISPLVSPSPSPWPCEVQLHVRPSRHVGNCHPAVKSKLLLSGKLPVPGGFKQKLKEPSPNETGGRVDSNPVISHLRLSLHILFAPTQAV